MMYFKRYKGPAPSGKDNPLRYHGVENYFLAPDDWRVIQRSIEWMKKPIVDHFRAEVVSIMARLRAKQEAA